MPRSDRVKEEPPGQGEQPTEAPQPQEEQPQATAVAPRRRTTKSVAQEPKKAQEAVTEEASPKKASTRTRGTKAAPVATSAKKASTGKSPSKEADAKVQPTEASAPKVAARIQQLQARYRQEFRPILMQEFGYRNPLQVPQIQKVVLNMGLGEALLNPRALESASRDLATITGQRPVITRARKSVAAFKVRQGQAIGATVTLRSHRMYDFFQRLVNAVLPRIRDFRGVSRASFDGQGNYTLGIREHVVFPEIDYNQVDRIRGLEVTIVTTAHSDGEALRLLELMGMPFARDGAGR